MRIRFDEQLELLNRKLIEMGALCEDAISASMHTLKNEADKKSAEKAAALEREIDHKEREIESLCMKLLLQQQPVARDLRTISSALKMISDLERIGDQASDIAGITGYIEDEQLKSGTHIYEMARAASRMVTDSVDSFVRKDLGKARAVQKEDDIVDGLFDTVKNELVGQITEHPDLSGECLDLLMIAKYLERIGDHLVNVAESDEYSITGGHVGEEGELFMIYLLEDDSAIRELVVYTLCSTGLEATGFAAPSEFYDAMERTLPELLILDIMLPEEDGLSILRRLRASPRTEHLPVMMLTARSSEYDKVIGLDGGADDYLTKPFGMMELISRVRALLRRAEFGRERRETLRCGDIECDTTTHTMRACGEELTLTLKEYELLHLMLEHPMQVFTRDRLLSSIWGYEFDGESRTVDVHIRSLRLKLGAAGGQIETVRGVGYRLRETAV